MEEKPPRLPIESGGRGVGPEEERPALSPRGGAGAGVHLTGLALCTLAFALWSSFGAGQLSWAVVAFFAGYNLVAWAGGGLLLRLLPGERLHAVGLPLGLLLGHLCLGAILLLLAWLLPLGLEWIGLGVAAAVAALARIAAPWPREREAGSPLPALLCIALSLAAATLWSRDCLDPIETRPGAVVIEPWQDSFVHAGRIATFAHGEGRETLRHFLYGDRPMPLYHYGGYLAPAALVALTSTPALAAFTGFAVPFAVFLTGLAAFALAGTLWGRWPGLASSAAVLLLPDAAQQGADNHFFSYHWLLQTAPALALGIAGAAAAWALLIEGCRAGRPPLVVAGWIVGATCVVYKAHVFVANALLWWIYPPLFLAGVGRRWRVAWLAAAVVVFGGVVGLSQGVARVPSLRLDASAAPTYPRVVVRWFEPGAARELFERYAPADDAGFLAALPWHGALLLFVTFGLLAPLCLGVALWVRRRTATSILLFPLLVTASYLAMALGLSLNERPVGRPEELLHRPFVWAWFALCVWTAGAAYHRVLGDGPPRSALARAAAVGAIALGLLVPLRLGIGLRYGPPFGHLATDHVVPNGLLAACEFLRSHAAPHDLVQDSSNDPELIVSALSERSPFAAVRSPDQPHAGHYLEEMRVLAAAGSVQEVAAFSRRTGLKWYLLRPEDSLAWPAELLEHPAFGAGGYRVYRLPGHPTEAAFAR
jgi:hypothetical protein